MLIRAISAMVPLPGIGMFASVAHLTSNNRFKQSRSIIAGEPRRESMIVINPLCSFSAHCRVAKADRYVPS
jgi:hypothetical protein